MEKPPPSASRSVRASGGGSAGVKGVAHELYKSFYERSSFWLGVLAGLIVLSSYLSSFVFARWVALAFSIASAVLGMGVGLLAISKVRIYREKGTGRTP